MAQNDKYKIIGACSTFEQGTGWVVNVTEKQLNNAGFVKAEKSGIGNLMMHSVYFEKYITVHEYLKHVLLALWNGQTFFYTRHSFGNSDWEYELTACLIKHNVIEGKIDNEGCIVEYDEKALHRIVHDYIKSM